MGMHCIIDSSSASLRRSLCVSFVVVCEDCAVSLLCWVRSVCFPFLSCTSSLSVCCWLFALFLSWCLSSACFCQGLLCLYCASAVPLQFTSNSAIVHLQCMSFPTNASQIDTPHSSTRIFLIRNSCSQVVTKWCLLLLVFCRKVASAVVAVIIRSLSLFRSTTLSVSLPVMEK